MAETAETTRRRGNRCRKHAFAPPRSATPHPRIHRRAICPGHGGHIRLPTPEFASGRAVHRYYNPTTGQFLNVDPLVVVTGSAYGYVDDDPVNNADPSGLSGGATGPSFAAVGCVRDPSSCQGTIGQSWIGKHWRGTVQVVGAVAGGVALASGVGELGLAAYAAGTGAETIFGGASVEAAAGVLGTTATTASVAGAAADLPGCVLGHGFDSDCVGVLGNVLGGGLGKVGDALSEGSFETELLPGLLRAGGYAFGSGTFAWDLFGAFSEAASADACG